MKIPKKERERREAMNKISAWYLTDDDKKEIRNKYKDIPTTRLYLLRAPDNAQEIDYELDSRNAENAKKIRRKKRQPKFKMADYEYEQAQIKAGNG
jgi:hypothetical protein